VSSANVSDPSSPVVRPAIPAPILAGRIIAIGRGLDPRAVVTIGEALVDGGVRSFEVTLDSPGAFDAIASLSERWSPTELLVGAGTVLDRGSAERAVTAGARFLVMPHTDAELVGWAADRDLPSFPGALTPTEILAAWRAGAAGVKLFPAGVLGPAFVRDLAGPFAGIPLVPTGGVTAVSAPDFIAAGAVAVGLGSWLTGGGDPARIRARAAEAAAAIAAVER
jgi:2-dehydro-3-deoxyphosphogluconate aldolase/(4S)-4-hydroxy-2-oxoglutarate aldolase